MRRLYMNTGSITRSTPFPLNDINLRIVMTMDISLSEKKMKEIMNDEKEASRFILSNSFKNNTRQLESLHLIEIPRKEKVS